MDYHKKLLIKRIAVVLYVLLVMFYFSPAKMDFKLPLPESLFAAAGFLVLPLPMALAALFSALGDWCGSATFENFYLQIAFFAVAHLCMIWFFLSLGLKHKKKGPRRSATYTAMTFAVAIALIYSVSNIIVPDVNNIVTSRFVLMYGCIITIMAWSALMQRDWLYGAAALLFVVSDWIIAYSRFVEHVPHAGLIIMSTYYVAQLLFFLRSAREREKN